MLSQNDKGEVIAMSNSTFKICKVEPKDGYMRPVHNGMLGRECKIIYLELNESAYLEVAEGDSEYHTILTSPVVAIEVQLASNVISFETRNTLYKLERL